MTNFNSYRLPRAEATASKGFAAHSLGTTVLGCILTRECLKGRYSCLLQRTSEYIDCVCITLRNLSRFIETCGSPPFRGSKSGLAARRQQSVICRGVRVGRPTLLYSSTLFLEHYRNCNRNLKISKALLKS